MKRLLLLSFSVLLSVTVFSQTAKEVKQSISNTAASIQTLACDFTQTKNMSLLSQPITSQGRMYYTTGNRLRWEYTTPYSYVFLLNGSSVTIQQGGQSNVMDIGNNSLFREIVRIMGSCMTGSCLAEDTSFTSQISVTSKEYIATLTPVRKELRSLFDKIILHFDRSAMMIVTIELLESSGDTTTINLKNVVTNKKIDDKMFLAD